jgi:hypothetical protein
MKKRLLQASLLVIICGLMWICSLSEVIGTANSFTGNYDRTFNFYVQYGDYRFNHKVYTSVTPSCYDYYHDKSHFMNSDNDYASFVTPSPFKSVAESIQNVTRDMPNNEEQFANAVLMLVRQISYFRSNAKYPVEALVDNSGDCDVLSLLAASIMKAGGLEVVLLYYKGLSPSHMNIGVYLPYKPIYRTWWTAPTGFDYNNKTYWMAECTPRGEWKVGDRPDLLFSSEPEIISLENCEKSSLAHVSASLDSPLIPSSISITLSSENSSAEENGHVFTISGSISPSDSGKSILMYINHDGTSCETFRTVTDDFGNYSLTWNCTSTGTYYIRTSLSGSSNYASADSETLTVFNGYQPVVGVDVFNFDLGPEDFFNRANAALSYKIFASQGSEEFLKDNLTGENVLLSGEFMMLSNGQPIVVPKVQEIITIPKSELLITLPGRRTMVIPRFTTTITEGEQTVNNQFGFILRHDGGDNYTATVKVMEDSAPQATEQLEGNSAFMNASIDTRDNTWYRVIAKINEDKRITELYDANGTLIQNAETRKDALNSGEFGVLMSYDINTVIAFKNLKAETLNQSTQPVNEKEASASKPEVPALYIGLTIILAVTVAAIACVKERKRGAND